MNLIKISNEYSIDIEKYNKIKIGDIIKSQVQLKREICYPSIIKNTTKVKNLQSIIESLIKYEKVGSGHEIRITHYCYCLGWILLYATITNRFCT